MILSRSRAAGKEPTVKDQAEQETTKIFDLEEYLSRRDYLGAITLLKFQSSGKKRNDEELVDAEWLAYCYFHYGEHAKALEIYESLLERSDFDPLYYLYAAACHYYMGSMREAVEIAQKGPKCPLRTRILFHSHHKLGDETKLMECHHALTDSIEDQLSLAATHFLRSHFQEATDIYKRLLLENRDYLALNVYVALCYCKLDYYDVSLEILAMYLSPYSDSALAVNLKACNHFKLYNGKAAENELKTLAEKTNGTYLENELIRHNLVVFRSGENAMQALPQLGSVPPEARLNMVIYHLRHNEIEEAEKLLENMEPSNPSEYVLKAVVHTCIGQMTDSPKDLKTAQQYFQLVGVSASECDTIPGRQCMASCFFLLKQFEDVLVFLNSIKTYFYNDDDFNWDYGIAKASLGNYKEAEAALLAIENEKYRSEYCYLAWLARCHIMNGKPRQAWELYLRMETSDDSFNLLQLIANDCYRMGSFYHSAKAFDVLERLDPNPEYWDGKRGACIGAFQMVIAGKDSPDTLRDIVSMLRNTSNPQVEIMVRLIKKWAKDNGVKCA
ncbi:hypothetical protein BSKO_12105 [Bryopsis sp. KO-2023]|nr:hypothetical protein BSKO_12105 [Bryopsis sp. KO-2023]